MDINLLEQNLTKLKKIYESETEFEEIKVIEIISKEITKPKMDGTYGSALYKVPFKLSQTPKSLWSQLFLKNWKSPMSFSSMHRPSIASIYDNQLILNGTTLEEIEKYHKETIIKCIDRTNLEYKENIKNNLKTQINTLKDEIEYYKKIQNEAINIKF